MYEKFDRHFKCIFSPSFTNWLRSEREREENCNNKNHTQRDNTQNSIPVYIVYIVLKLINVIISLLSILYIHIQRFFLHISFNFFMVFISFNLNECNIVFIFRWLLSSMQSTENGHENTTYTLRHFRHYVSLLTTLRVCVCVWFWF